MIKNAFRKLVLLLGLLAGQLGHCQVINYPSGIGASRTEVYQNPSHKVPDWGGGHNVRHYGAKGDGVTDDTQAIQAALDANRRGVDRKGQIDYFYPRPKTVYFPKGTYLVSGTLEMVGEGMMLIGQGRGQTVIRLKDKASGFSSANSPKPVLMTQDGIHQFRNYVRDLTVNIGSGNAGAVGIDFVANNSGGIVNVEIKSEDGKGRAGVSMTRAYPGPCMLKQVWVSGFDFAFEVGRAEYSITFEDITISGQRVAGVENNGNMLLIRKLTSTNTVPAIRNRNQYGMVTLLDSRLTGGAAGAAGVENTAGALFARGVSTSGYGSALRDKGVAVGGHAVEEYVSSGKATSLFPSPGRSLGLPVEETPDYHNNDTTQWAELASPGWYGDNRTWQNVINSGKPVIYWRPGTYMADNRTYPVPLTVRKFMGFGAAINNNGKGTAVRLVISEGNENSPPLIIEHVGYGLTIDHRCKRPVVLKRTKLMGYTATEDAGKVYFEDVELTSLVTFQPGQQVWARQFNSEILPGRIWNKGADVWVLGIKTELKGYVVKTTDCGRTEVLGGLIYPIYDFTSADPPAFISEEAQHSLIFRATSYHARQMYPVLVEERRAGTVRQMKSGSQVHNLVPLHVGFDETACGNAAAPPVLGSDAPYFVNAGGAPTTTATGTFAADNYFASGEAGSKAVAIAGTTDPVLYQTERTTRNDHGTLTYAFPVSNGPYNVVLHFAELSKTGVGQRVFDVSLEGARVLNDFDIFRKAGGLTATIERLVVTVTDGTLNLSLSALAADGGVGKPTISAIEVTQASKPLSALGMAPLHAAHGFANYPNPVKDHLIIQNNSAIHHKADVEIRNMQGQTVYKAGKVIFAPGQVHTCANLQHLPPALYFLHVSGEKINFMQKFAVN